MFADRVRGATKIDVISSSAAIFLRKIAFVAEMLCITFNTPPYARRTYFQQDKHSILFFYGCDFIIIRLPFPYQGIVGIEVATFECNLQHKTDMTYRGI